MSAYFLEIKIRTLRIIVISFILFSIVWAYSGGLVESLIKLSTESIITVNPYENIETELLLSSVISGIVLAPYIVFEIYRFISPALKKQERQFIKIGFVSLYGPFVSGVVIFGYILLESALFMVDKFQIEGVNQTVSEYSFMNFAITMFISGGVLACIPFVAGSLTYFELINSNWLTKYWKQFVVCSMIVSAIISPGVDVLSMLLFEIPLLGVFGMSILVSKTIEIFKAKNAKGDKKCLELPN